MKLIVCFFVLALGLCQAASTTRAPPTTTSRQCLSDEDCSAEECCYKKHEFLVVSKKREGTFEGYPTHDQDLTHKIGVCQRYTNDGEYCSLFDKANGFCGCKNGSSCKYVSYDADKSMEAGHYGSYNCVSN